MRPFLPPSLIVAVGLTAAPALAAPEAREILDLEATALSVGSLQTGSGPHLVVHGPGRVFLVSIDTGEVSFTEATTATTSADLGLGRLALCGPDGLVVQTFRSRGLGVPVPLAEAPCTAVAFVEAAGEDRPARLVWAADEVWTATYDQLGTLGPPETLDLPLEGPPILATHGPRLAIADPAGEAIHEITRWGPSTLPAQGRPGGLALGPDAWTWTLPSAGRVRDATGSTQPVPDPAGPLVRVALRDPEIAELWALTADPPGLVRVDGPTGAPPLALPAGTRAVHPVDADGDPCAEIAWVTSAGRVGLVDDTCGPGLSPGARIAKAIRDVREPDDGPSAPPPSANGIERLVLGGGKDPTLYVPLGGRLERQLIDARGEALEWRVVNGPDGLETTPEGRVTMVPGASDYGGWRVAVELRTATGWTRTERFTLIVSRPSDSADNPADLPPPKTRPDRVARVLEHEVGGLQALDVFLGCQGSGGAAIGVTAAQRSWVLVGQRGLISGSAVLRGGCDLAIGSRGWVGGSLEMAPWFNYVINDARLAHGLAMTLDGGWRSETVQVGAHVTGGLTVVGVGLNGRWLPFEDAIGGHHGPEVRLNWFIDRQLVLQGMVLYTIQFRKDE